MDSDGTVVAVGCNNYGQCNVRDWRNIVAIAAGGSHTTGLKADGTVVAVGCNDYGQCDVQDWRDIVAIAVGDDDSEYAFTEGQYAHLCHTIGLKSDGTVVAVGCNIYGQCNVQNWKLFNSIDTLEQERAEVKRRKQENARRQEEEEQHRIEEATLERDRQKTALEVERKTLQTDLSNLKGLFTGKRQREIKARLKEVEQELASLNVSLKDMH